jgi:tetratricopeptide (TPR) repeat protein
MTGWKKAPKPASVSTVKKEGFVPDTYGSEGAIKPAGAPKGPAPLSLILRTAALFAILWQFRLLARDLPDTPVFMATLFCAFVSAWILAKRNIKAVPAVLSLLLIPWTARTMIALSRFLVSGPVTALDSLLLGFDRNSFVFLPPFYWAAVTTFFAARSRRFLRGDIVAAQGLLLVIFCMTRSADLEAYRWPVLMIGFFAALVFLQLLALLLSLPPEYLARRTEKLPASAALFILVLIGGILMIRPSQEGAVDRGGGLLQPNLFRFDFSQILRLESEIRMNDDLVLIVRRPFDGSNVLLRRFVLSGYNVKQGFYRHETIDEAAHPQRLPGGRTLLEPAPVRSYRIMDQEYFLVNFDPSAFIGMNEPVEIVPFESWDASSFSSAYGVQSHISDSYPFELMDAVPDRTGSVFSGASGEYAEFGPEVLGLTPEDFAYYTEYGGDKRIAAFAREITGGFTNYWEMVQMVYDRLKYGEYRYSLKPGIAPDGDQLGYFLFEAKKGYCSYYAFAMTLLLRSLGIPSRAAVGFFIAPEQSAFDYYPVRSDMAHAWVEVYFPQYGWIEFDPTTEQLAEDEEFRFSSGVPQELFDRLMKEILENRSRLVPKEGGEADSGPVSLSALGKSAGRFIQERWALLFAGFLIILFIIMRAGLFISSILSRDPRKKAVRLWSHTLRRLALAGFNRRSLVMAESEWTRKLDEDRNLEAYTLYRYASAARYAPAYTQEDFMELRNRYALFSSQYRKTVALYRRILAWLCPPLALALGPGKAAKSGKGPDDTGPSRRGYAGIAGLALFLIFTLNADTIPAQDGDLGVDLGMEITGQADALFEAATEAQGAEFWERAIELYSQGEKLFPGDSRFPWALGSLYYSRKLYGLAWEEYRKVETLFPFDPDILYRLSRVAGYLNRDAVSAGYLERVLAIAPDYREAIGSLGWMYYKLHRLKEGEELLRAALERFGPDPDFSMTLGTIYSDMFRYEEAKAHYLEAIAGGENVGDREFAAVAYYNLSILESRFYKYREAFDQTNASLASRNRASGRLARGELFLRRLELPRVFSEYQSAYEIDTSPLSKVNLAQVYQIAGRLEEARLYAEDCLTLGDLSWMLNYGIDPDRYKRDLHDILYKTYTGLANAGGREVYGTAAEALGGFFRRWLYRYKALSHRFLFQKYSLISAGAYSAYTAGADGSGSGDDVQSSLGPDAWLQYYDAFKPYPQRALVYLRNARNQEVPLVDAAVPSYDLEEGILLKDRELLRRSIPDFDPLWERDMIADTYSELYPLLKGRNRRFERFDAAERLYALNRGALRQKGIDLPVELTISAATEDASAVRGVKKTEKALRRTLRQMGIDEVPRSPDSAAPDVFSPRFRLDITVAAGEAHCILHDGGRGVDVFRESIPLESVSPRDLAGFARILGDGLFTEE